jgi:hypothetical protein
MEFLHIEKTTIKKEKQRQFECIILKLNFLIFKENKGISAFKI